MKIIRYTILQETNIGSDENPVVQQKMCDVSVGPMADSVFEANLAVAQREAYNGEITVEDIPDPVTEPTELDLAVERIAELEATNAALEDAMCEMDAANQEQITELQATNVALEDAMCEMDAANEARFSTIEDALCELDMV